MAIINVSNIVNYSHVKIKTSISFMGQNVNLDNNKVFFDPRSSDTSIYFSCHSYLGKSFDSYLQEFVNCLDLLTTNTTSLKNISFDVHSLSGTADYQGSVISRSASSEQRVAEKNRRRQLIRTAIREKFEKLQDWNVQIEN